MVALRKTIGILLLLGVAGCTGQELAGEQCWNASSREGTVLRVCDDGFGVRIEELAPFAHSNRPARYSPKILAYQGSGSQRLPNNMALPPREGELGDSSYQATVAPTAGVQSQETQPWPMFSPPAITQVYFQVTAAEKMACWPDVVRLCADRIPDATQVFLCMKQKRTQLNLACKRVAAAHGL